MDLTIRAYQETDLPAMIAIWNEIVEEGIAFPQEDCLDGESGRAFFAAQSYTGVAVDRETEKLLGLYILHPNNVGRCGHICNASYAVASRSRGLHIGQQLAVTNLLVLETDIHLTSGDAEGRQTVRLTGAGHGTFCCGGRAIPIQWSRGDRNSPLRYTLETGAALALGQGKTYICIIDPDSGSMELSPAAA